MKLFLIRRWFLVALATVVAVGITQSDHLQLLASRREIRYGIVATVLFMMALPLQASAMWRSMRRPWPPLLAVAINFGLLPLVAWGMSFVLTREMASGLFIAASTPCTLASAAVWTRRAGGNDSVALMVTVITNLSCFVMTPLWLLWMTGKQPDSEALDLGPMIVKLGLLVVLPMSLAQVLRLWRPIGIWATRQTIPLGVCAQCGVLSMIFMGSIQTGIRLSDTESSFRFGEFLLMVVVVLGIHLGMLATGMMLGTLFRFSRGDRIAVGIAGSQKTLMVGLQVGMDLGFSVLPIVVYHVGQLLLDTLIADRLRKHGGKVEAQHPAPPEEPVITD